MNKNLDQTENKNENIKQISTIKRYTRKLTNDLDNITEQQIQKKIDLRLSQDKQNQNDKFCDQNENNYKYCHCRVCDYDLQHQNDHIETRYIEIDDDSQKRIVFRNQEKIQLFLACRQLINMDGEFSMSDPFINLFTKEEENGEWEFQGSTEIIDDNLNPNFHKTFLLEYKADIEQYLKFECIDYDDKSPELIGRMECTIKNIILDDDDQTIIYPLFGEDGEENGKIIVRAEKEDCENNRDMQNAAEHLRSVQKAEESDFGFLIKNLMYPPRLRQGLTLNLPTTIFFQNGKCSFMAYTHQKEKTLRFTTYQKKTNLAIIRKEMHESKYQYEQDKRDTIAANQISNFEHKKQRKNLYCDENNIKLISKIQNIKQGKTFMNKKESQNNIQWQECKECSQKYQKDNKACKYLCEDCRAYFFKVIEQQCTCYQEKGCMLKVIYKQNDLQDCVIVKKQIIEPKTETDHPAFFGWNSNQINSQIQIDETQKIVQLQTSQISQFQSQFQDLSPIITRNCFACLQPQLTKQKKIKIEIKFTQFKNNSQIGIGILYSNIEEDDELFFSKKPQGQHQGYFIFGDYTVSPSLPKKKQENKKQGLKINQGDTIEMFYNPTDKILEFQNLNTQKIYERTNIIIKDNTNFIPVVILSNHDDTAEYINATEVSDITMQTFKKYEQQYVINEFEYNHLMLKRISHPIWNNIQYIQNYVKLDSQLGQKVYTTIYDFQYDKEYHDPLYLRAYNDILILNQEISKANSKYVDREIEYNFEKKLMKEQPKNYTKYMTYKIVNFVEILHNQRISKMKTQWVVDEIGQILLIGVEKLIHLPFQRRYVPKHEFLEKKTDDAEKQLKSLSKMQEQFEDVSGQENVKNFTKQLLNIYKAKKNYLGIDMTQNISNEFQQSNKVFKQIYPKSNFQLTDVIGSINNTFNASLYDVQNKMYQEDIENIQKRQKELQYINTDKLNKFELLRYNKELEQYQINDQQLKNYPTLYKESQILSNNNSKTKFLSSTISKGSVIFQQQSNKISQHLNNTQNQQLLQNQNRILNKLSKTQEFKVRGQRSNTNNNTHRSINSNQQKPNNILQNKVKISEFVKNSPLININLRKQGLSTHRDTRAQTNYTTKRLNTAASTSQQTQRLQQRNNFMKIMSDNKDLQKQSATKKQSRMNNVYFSQQKQNTLPFILYQDCKTQNTQQDFQKTQTQDVFQNIKI